MKTPVAEQVFGLNKAPLDVVLETDFADVASEAEALVAEVRGLPTKVRDETDFAMVGTVAVKVGALVKSIDTKRKAETDPLFDMQKAIKAHFDTIAAKITAAMAPYLDAANVYTREKAAQERRQREEEQRQLAAEEEKLRAKAANSTGAAAVRAEARADAVAAQAETITTSVKASDAVRTKMSGGGVATAKTSWAYDIVDYDKIDLNVLRPFFNRDHVEAAIRSMVRVQKGNTKISGVRVFEDAKASFRK